MKKRLLSLSLTLLFLIVALSPSPPTYALLNGTEQQITTDLNAQFDPAIDGSYIVFTDNRDGTSDVYLHDLDTGAEFPIANTEEDEFLNDVSANLVVYTLATFDDDDIYVYDIDTGDTRQITDPEDNQSAMRRDPAVSGNYIVWQDDRNGHFDIYLYDWITETETLISTGEGVGPAVGDQIHPAIHENLVVWQDTSDPSNPDIYLYDISDPDPEPALIPVDDPSTPWLQAFPDVCGRYVVFDEASLTDLSNRDIILWDLDTSTGVSLTHESTASQEKARIDGMRVVWEDSRLGNIDIFTYDITTGTVEAVTTDPSMQFLNDISGNRIVWTDLRNICQEYPGNYDIYMFTLAEEPPPPPPPEPDINVNPQSLLFGEVEIGESSLLIATISNLGDAPLEVDMSIWEPGPQWWDFTWTPTSATVDPGSVLDLVVTFSPSGGVSISGVVIISNDPDEPYVYLTFTGFGVEVPIPPNQLFQDLLDFYDTHIASEGLQGIGPGNSPENRENAIRNMILAASTFYNEGRLHDACDQLWDIYLKIDGESPPASPPDFIEGDAVEEFRQRVLELLDAIGCNA